MSKNSAENFEAPVIDTDGRFHCIKSSGDYPSETIRETISTHNGERIETIFGATDTEILFWNEIVRLRMALKENGDMVRHLELEAESAL